MIDRFARTWAEVSLDAITVNYHALRNKIGDRKLLGVVKANAYGHGAVQIAEHLQKLGCDYLAVACIQEAEELRNGGITLPILILGRTDPAYTEDIIRLDITQSVGDTETAREFSKRALAIGGTVKAHLKLDSGMGRLGFKCHGGVADDAMLEALTLPGLAFEGVFTHFAVSDVPGGEEYTLRQLREFTSTVSALEQRWNRKFALRHCANSGATLDYESAYLDMVRPGILMYGCYPGNGIGLKPVMSLKTKLVQTRYFEKGDTVSYGRIFTAQESVRIGVIPVGYADGLPRIVSGKIDVLINGVRCRQVGRICMDMCMVDLSNAPEAKVGDIVTVFGCDGDEEITADELAGKADTISYEMLCAVSPRVPRVYIKDGAVI